MNTTQDPTSSSPNSSRAENTEDMQNSDMPKAYDWKQYEDTIYTKWNESGLFNPDNLPDNFTEPYAIMMPPPNVTGVLHLGHALENTIMDIQARHQRMQGKRVLLLPGTDHSAVATQARVEDNLKKQGIENPRQEYGREGLLKLIREFAEQSKTTILGQIKKMGTSADWSRLAYTFDDERSAAVNELFIRMYNDGLIYRGYRVVNWSVVGQSTASDDEVEHEERTTTLYTFKYSKDFPIPIATVQPETKLGDTAVAVHPDDKRYQQYIGQTFTVDVGAKDPLTIHVIADTEVDPKFGTGALGVTPAHSKTDFEMYQKNQAIGMIQVIGKDGTMTEHAGSYAGLPVQDARKQFVQWLRDEGLMISEEEIMHNISLSDRFRDEIWPMPMEQWFLAIDKEIPGRGKSLKVLMKDVVDNKITIQPERFAKTASDWIENYHDWCISRQIWWGHRIPVWYKGDDVVASVTQPEGEGWTQDEDTLDTWFSSAAWTFSTLGWPDETTDMHTFHPTAWMQMGHEIIRLWLVRMILMSTYALDDIPFKDVYVHGILRDKDGKKFSKSSGNGIDPLDMIEKYGTDALRMSLIKGITPGSDSRFYEEKVEDARNFVNKLWNTARFVMMQETSEQETSESNDQELSMADKSILTRVNQVIQQVNSDLEKNDFSRAAEEIYKFVWNDFADWYIELSKLQPNSQLAREILETILKLAHPFMPFVTEQIWQETGHDTLLMMEQWPHYDQDRMYQDEMSVYESLQDIITQIRNIRAQYKISYKDSFALHTSKLPDAEYRTAIEQLCKVTLESTTATGATTELTNAHYNFTISLGDIIDTEAEKKRLEKDITQLQTYVSSLDKKLANTEYTSNAPADVVERDRQSLHDSRQQVATLQSSLDQL